MSTDEKSPASTPEQEDGRAKEWQDRGRVALPEDIDPNAKSMVERDFEPESTSSKKPPENNAY